MFPRKLKNAGGQNPTHNASAGWMSEEEVAYLEANLDPSFKVYEPAPGVAPESPLVTIKRFGYEMWQAPL